MGCQTSTEVKKISNDQQPTDQPKQNNQNGKFLSAFSKWKIRHFHWCFWRILLDISNIINLRIHLCYLFLQMVKEKFMKLVLILRCELF